MFFFSRKLKTLFNFKFNKFKHYAQFNRKFIIEFTIINNNLIKN